jgi:hypothetical protein
MSYWRLIVPGVRYRPAPTPDDPVARDARETAARDLEAGHGPKDWPPEELHRRLEDRRGYWTWHRSYYTARWPERLLAPASWPDQLLLIALSTLIAAHATDTWASVLALLPLQNAVDRLEHTARLRSATRLGVTPETMPLSGSAGPAWLSGTVWIGAWLWRKVRGEPQPVAMSWPAYLAMRLVNAVIERRSWRRAYRG